MNFSNPVFCHNGYYSKKLINSDTIKKTWLAPRLSCPYLASESVVLSDAVKKKAPPVWARACVAIHLKIY